MMDRNALAKSSAKCWERLAREFSRVEDFESAEWAAFEADYCDQRAWRAGLVF